MAWRKPKNLSEWFGVLKRHKKKAFFPAVAAMIGIISASHLIPREYRAEAKFERRMGLTSSQAKSDITTRQVEADRRLLVEDIRGRAAIEQLIADLDMTRGLPRVNGELTAQGQLGKLDLIREVTGRVSVKVQVQNADNELIAVSYTSTEREKAPEVANRLVENYIRKNKLELSETLKGAYSFFQKEVLRFSTHVRELESKKLRFEMDHRGLLPDDPQSVQTKLVELRAQLATASKDYRQSTGRREALKTWVGEQPEFIAQEQTGLNPVYEERQTRIRELYQQVEQNKQFGRKDDHPEVKKLKATLAVAEEELKKTPKTIKLGERLVPNEQRTAAERELRELSTHIQSLERERGELQGQVDHYEILSRNFFVVRNDYLRILRELKEAESQLTFWQDRERQTKIALTTEVSQRGVRLRFRQRAPEMARPSKPTPIQIGAVAVIIGLGVAGVMIVLAELLDRSFRGVEQAVDELKLPVLGAVNEIVTPGLALRRRLMGWGVYPALGLAMLLVLVGAFAVAYISLEHPHHFEQLKKQPADFIQRAILGD